MIFFFVRYYIFSHTQVSHANLTSPTSILQDFNLFFGEIRYLFSHQVSHASLTSLTSILQDFNDFFFGEILYLFSQTRFTRNSHRSRENFIQDFDNSFFGEMYISHAAVCGAEKQCRLSIVCFEPHSNRKMAIKLTFDTFHRAMPLFFERIVEILTSRLPTKFTIWNDSWTTFEFFSFSRLASPQSGLW